ncbi:MAG: sulfurtransferase-like selenium metabolism protein YedF [Helicobacter sp.]|nr:sulfurtransferase-like selenium metabolism protein YedF [Helicobacter sp.]
MQNVQIDVRNLSCPEPIVRTQKALLHVNAHALTLRTYSILGNSPTAKENLTRFLEGEGFSFELDILENGEFLFRLIDRIKKSEPMREGEKIAPKMLLVKGDGIGEGDLGVLLLRNFIKALLQTEILPQKILFIHRGVLLTTENDEIDNTEICDVLKQLEKQGVEIYSCGSCLEYFSLAGKLKVGVVGNAVEGMQNMLASDSLVVL